MYSPKCTRGLLCRYSWVFVGLLENLARRQIEVVGRLRASLGQNFSVIYSLAKRAGKTTYFSVEISRLTPHAADPSFEPYSDIEQPEPVAETPSEIENLSRRVSQLTSISPLP